MSWLKIDWSGPLTIDRMAYTFDTVIPDSRRVRTVTVPADMTIKRFFIEAERMPFNTTPTNTKENNHE